MSATDELVVPKTLADAPIVPEIDEDSLSETSSVADESAPLMDNTVNEKDDDSVDDRDLPDNVIHSVTLQNKTGDLMTFTLRSDDKGLRLIDISGATPLTLSAETFEGIVEDLFLDIRREEKLKQQSIDQHELWEEKRMQDMQLLYTLSRIFLLFFLFMLIVVSIARVL